MNTVEQHGDFFGYRRHEHQRIGRQPLLRIDTHLVPRHGRSEEAIALLQLGQHVAPCSAHEHPQRRHLAGCLLEAFGQGRPNPIQAFVHARQHVVGSGKHALCERPLGLGLCQQDDANAWRLGSEVAHQDRQRAGDRPIVEHDRLEGLRRAEPLSKLKGCGAHFDNRPR